MRFRNLIASFRSDSSGATLARGAAASFGIKSASIGAMFLCQVVLARTCGPENFGRYAYAMGWANLLGIFCIWGFDTAAMRFIADYRATGELGKLKGFLRYSRKTVLLFSCVTGGVLAVALNFLPKMDEHLGAAFLAMTLLLPINGQVLLSTYTLLGFKNVLAGLSPHALGKPLLLIGLVTAAGFASGGRLSAAAAIQLEIVAAAAALGALWLFTNKELPAELPATIPKSEGGLWLSTASSFLFIAGLNVALKQTDLIFLGALRTTTEAGIYSAASQLALGTSLVLTAVNSLAAPTISELHAKGDREELQRIVLSASRVIGALAFAAFMGIVALGPLLLSLYGETFTEGFVPLVILGAGQLGNSLCGFVGFLLTMTGNQKHVVTVMGVSAAINAALNWLLIPAYGAAGAATATSVSLLGWNLALTFYVKKDLGLTPPLAAFFPGAR